MMVSNLVRLIERHSEQLGQELTKRIRESERTFDFRNIPPERLQLAAVEVYRNLGLWLLQKTESDIEKQFGAIAARGVGEGIGLLHFFGALMVSRNHL